MFYVLYIPVYCFCETIVDFGSLICVNITIKGHIFHGQYLFREMSACKKGLLLSQARGPIIHYDKNSVSEVETVDF